MKPKKKQDNNTVQNVGEETITNCPKCEEKIRGEKQLDN